MVEFHNVVALAWFFKNLSIVRTAQFPVKISFVWRLGFLLGVFSYFYATSSSLAIQLAPYSYLFAVSV